MPIHVLIPGPLRPFADGCGRVALPVSPATVGDALEALAALHPGIRERVVTERGNVRPHINIFVGENNIRDARGLETAVPDGSEIAILPAVSGG
jgi:molybdopterin converting factor small subunit